MTSTQQFVNQTGAVNVNGRSTRVVKVEPGETDIMASVGQLPGVTAAGRREGDGADVVAGACNSKSLQRVPGTHSRGLPGRRPRGGTVSPSMGPGRASSMAMLGGESSLISLVYTLLARATFDPTLDYLGRDRSLRALPPATKAWYPAPTTVLRTSSDTVDVALASTLAIEVDASAAPHPIHISSHALRSVLLLLSAVT